MRRDQERTDQWDSSRSDDRTMIIGNAALIPNVSCWCHRTLLVSLSAAAAAGGQWWMTAAAAAAAAVDQMSTVPSSLLLTFGFDPRVLAK